MSEDKRSEQERPGNTSNPQQMSADLEKEEKDITDLQQQLFKKEKQLQVVLQQLAEKENIIRAKNQEIKTKDQKLEEKERDIFNLRGEVANLKKLVKTLQSGIKLKLQWRTRRDAPEGVFRGSAVVHNNNVYCISHSSSIVYCYRFMEDQWEEHSYCPHLKTGLAIINKMLTAIGGKTQNTTNKLVSWRDEQWEEVFSPMAIARCGHAVVSDDSYVIAAGGMNDETSVELFKISSNTWSTVASLPQPLCRITATLCNDRIYAMDDYGSAFSILMSDLTPDISRDLPASQSCWLPLSSAVPRESSTLCAVNGVVMAVGGSKENRIPEKDIYAYNVSSGKWIKVGCMDTQRFLPIVAVLPGDKIVVVGGRSGENLSPISLFTTVEVAFLC